MTVSLVSTRKGPVEVSVTGAGPAILVVHGIPGDWRQARTVEADYADRFTVIAPSRPGYGQTPLSVGRTPAEQASAYVDVLMELGVDDALVIGVSGGGPSSYSFASNHSERCRGLVLCCPVAAHVPIKAPAMELLSRVPLIWEGLTALDVSRQRQRLADRHVMAVEIRRSLTPTESDTLVRHPERAADLEQFAWDRLVAVRNGIAGMRNDVKQLLAARKAGPTPWRAGSSLPVEVVHGDMDEVVRPEHARFYEQAVPSASLTLLPGVGHAVPLTAREEFRSVVDKAIARSGAASSG